MDNTSPATTLDADPRSTGNPDGTEPTVRLDPPHPGDPMDRPRASRRTPLLRRLGLDTVYVLSAWPLGMAGLLVAVGGISVGISTVVIWVGLPILALTLTAAARLAQLERARLRAWQDRDVTSPIYLRPGPDAGPLAQLLTPLRDPQPWLDAVWGVVGFVTSTVVFCVALAWWGAVFAGLTSWAWLAFLPDAGAEGLSSLLGLGDHPVVRALVDAAGGLVALATLPWVMRACARLHAWTADTLLNARGDLAATVRQEQGARVAAQEAEAVALRRLERDIHDGPQQRLVRLTMDLGRARRQVGDDPETAAVVDSALRQARETLDELRALSRGIAPPLLVDRGLGVALDEFVVRSPVRVELHHELPVGLSPHVETAVYFIVSEALTNVAKHSGADVAEVRVAPEGSDLVVRVVDHGVGGAHPGRGSGLVGLQQRAAAVGGTLLVDSPAGGPTVLTARLPRGR